MRGERSCSKTNLSDLFQSSTLGVLQVVFMHIFCSWKTQPGSKVEVTLEFCVFFVAEQVCLSDPFNLFHFFRTQETPLEMTHYKNNAPDEQSKWLTAKSPLNTGRTASSGAHLPLCSLPWGWCLWDTWATLKRQRNSNKALAHVEFAAFVCNISVFFPLLL